MRILLKDVKKIYSPEADLDQYKHIIIDGNKIESLVKKDALKINNFDKVINCKDMVALPGLINTHTHSSMSLLRGYADDYDLDRWLKEKIWPAEAKLTKKDIYWGAKLSILEMVRTGTTTFADMYFKMDKVAEAVSETGIRAVLSEGLIENNDGKQGFNDAVDFCLRWQNKAKGRIKTCLGPHSAYSCSPDYLKLIRDKALQHNLLINIHISETKDEVDMMQRKHDLTTVGLLEKIDFFKAKVIAPHCVHLTERDIDILKKHRVGVVYNPMSNMKLGSGIAPIHKLLKKGINVSYGTDGAASNNNLDLIEEARLGSYLQKVALNNPQALPIEDTLRMLTLSGASNLGIDNLGEIKQGYLADIILVNIENNAHNYPSYNHLSNIFYASNGSDVDTVIINGKVVMENREMNMIDEKEVYHKVEKLTEKYHKNF